MKQIHKPERIDSPNTCYQIALEFVDIIENTIKPKLRKNLLNDYDVDCVIDLFSETIKVNQDSDLRKVDWDKLQLKYCIKCGSETEPLEPAKNQTWFCKNGCKQE